MFCIIRTRRTLLVVGRGFPTSCASNPRGTHTTRWLEPSSPPPPSLPSARASAATPRDRVHPSTSLARLACSGVRTHRLPSAGNMASGAPGPAGNSSSSPRSASCFYSLLLFVATCWRHGTIGPASWAGMGWIFARLLVVTIT
jgi:hypothetical protein